MVSSNNPRWIDLGKLKDFLGRIKKTQTMDSEYEYRFVEASDDFWLLEAENEDEILGALLHVEEDRVYAISEDVASFVNRTLV